ncbi:hypothetical protein VQL36_13365 [Chengkuizengella sp. SCS-71B]
MSQGKNTKTISLNLEKANGQLLFQLLVQMEVNMINTPMALH